MTGPVLSFGDALAYGLAGGVQNYTQLNNQYNQQAIQQGNTMQDQQYRAQQAAEQQRQFDTQFKANRDTQTFQFLNGQQQQLTTTLAKGGYTKDSAEYKAAQQALIETNKLMSRTLRGQDLSSEDLSGYDTLMGNLGTLMGAGAQNIGNRAGLHDDLTNQGLAGGVDGQNLQNDLARQVNPYTVRNAAASAGLMENKYSVDTQTMPDQIKKSGADATVAANGAVMSDFDVQYARDTLPKKIEGFNAQQDVVVMQRDILAAVAPFQTAAGKAQALKQIGASGGVAAGAVQDLIDKGLLDPETTSAARTLMGLTDKQDVAGTTTAVNNAEQSGIAVQLNQKQLDQVKATYESTVALVNGSNELGTQKNAVLKGLLQLEGAASKAKYLGDVASLGEIGVSVINGLAKDGVIDQATADAATTKAQRVATAETTQLDILVDQGAMTKNDRDFSDQTLTSRTDLFNSDSSLRVKTNAAELDLLSFKSAAQRGAYLQGLAKMGSAGTAILGNLVTNKVITQDQADAFKPMADNAQKLDDTTTESAAFNLSSAKELFPIQLKSSQVALESAAAQLAAFNEKRPFDLKLLKANVATLEQDLSQNAKMFGTKLSAAQAQLRQLQSAVRVAEGTEAASIAAPGLANQVTEFNLSSAKELFPTQLASSQTALASANEQLAAFREGRPVNLGILKANLATLNQDLSQNGQLFGSKLAQAQAQVKQLESQVRVMDQPDQHGGIAGDKRRRCRTGGCGDGGRPDSGPETHRRGRAGATQCPAHHE